MGGKFNIRESIFEIGGKTRAKGKPRINPISVPTKSTKNPYQKQTEGLKRANVSKASYAYGYIQ